MIERRYLTLSDACEYTGLGRTKAHYWLKEIGAKRTIGARSVRYDRYVIEEVLNEQSKQNEAEAVSDGNTGRGVDDGNIVYRFFANA